MKKSELKQLIQEVILESTTPMITNVGRPGGKAFWVIGTGETRGTPLENAYFWDKKLAGEAWMRWIEATEELQTRDDGIRGDRR